MTDLLLATCGLIICMTAVRMVLRNRWLRRRVGDMPIRFRPEGSNRWRHGRAIWISDVFAWRRSPAGWREHIHQVIGCRLISQEVEGLIPVQLGKSPFVARLWFAEGGTMDIAGRAELETLLLGPYLSVPTAP